MIVSSERGTWGGHKRMITQEKSFVSIVEVHEKHVHVMMPCSLFLSPCHPGYFVVMHVIAQVELVCRKGNMVPCTMD